jgi:hypothetical protein
MGISRPVRLPDIPVSIATASSSNARPSYAKSFVATWLGCLRECRGVSAVRVVKRLWLSEPQVGRVDCAHRVIVDLVIIELDPRSGSFSWRWRSPWGQTSRSAPPSRYRSHPAERPYRPLGHGANLFLVSALCQRARIARTCLCDAGAMGILHAIIQPAALPTGTAARLSRRD